MTSSSLLPQGSPSSLPSDVLLRIEKNTAETATWMKYLTFAVLALVVVTAFFFL